MLTARRAHSRVGRAHSSPLLVCATRLAVADAQSNTTDTCGTEYISHIGLSPAPRAPRSYIRPNSATVRSSIQRDACAHTRNTLRRVPPKSTRKGGAHHSAPAPASCVLSGIPIGRRSTPTCARRWQVRWVRLMRVDARLHRHHRAPTLAPPTPAASARRSLPS